MLHAVQKWYCKEGPEMSEANIKYINAPLSEATIKDLHAGDVVRISGYIYTARDAAHKRMTEALAKGEQLTRPSRRMSMASMTNAISVVFFPEA